MKLQLLVNSCKGYSADQVKGITVGELRDALADFDDDDEIVTYDSSNAYGASFGQVTSYIEECETEPDDIEEYVNSNGRQFK